jgi:hypothetical protein
MSAEKYAQWIVDNQDKQGSPEFETVASAYKAAREQTKPAQPKKQSNNVSAEASKAAAEGLGLGDALAVAAGQGFDKMAMGLKDLTLAGVERFAPESFANAAKQEREKQARLESEKDAIYAGLKAARPIATGAGEAIPSIMATGLAGLLPSAAVTGGMEALKYGSPEERASRGVVGAGSTLIGGAVGQKVANLISPVASKMLSSGQRAALKAAIAMGYRPRISEVTGSPLMARIEDVAARTPGGAGVMQDFAQANQNAVNRRAAQSIGETADEMTPQVFSDAATRLGKTFQEIKDLPGKQIAISPKVGEIADELLKTQSKQIAAQRDPALTVIAKQAKMLAQNSGKIDGETYQLTRSGLSDQAFDATGTNKALYGKLLGALDDSAEQSLKASGNEALAKALREVRPQYANLKTLEKGMVAEGGNVSPARLAAALRNNNPSAFRQGKLEGNPLYDIAKIGENMKPLKAGSPTYEREATADILSSLIRAPLAYTAAKATTSPMMTAYPRFIANNPTAALLADQTSKAATPAAKALAAALAQRMLLNPVMAENQ